MLVEQWLSSSSGREFPSQKLPSHCDNWEAKQSVLSQRGVFCFLVFFLTYSDMLMQIITKKFCSCIQSEAGEESMSSNNRGHKALFHPCHDWGKFTTLISCKKKCQCNQTCKETACAQAPCPWTQSNLTYPIPLYTRSSWSMEMKHRNNQEIPHVKGLGPFNSALASWALYSSCINFEF